MDKKIVLLNDEFLPINSACVSVLDRGFLFGDGVYEVIPVHLGKSFRAREHLQRLQKSLDAIGIRYKVNFEKFENYFLQLLKLNNFFAEECSLYVQITRGSAIERTHHFPATDVKPTVFISVKVVKKVSYEELSLGKSAITLQDIRWKHCDIKSISLLPSVLLAQQVFAAGCDEGILIRNGHAIEGISSNVFIVKNGEIITPPLSRNNLSGVTRDLILQIISEHNLPFKERRIKASELKTADEIWISSSPRTIFPIIKLNNRPVGLGEIGEIWQKVIRLYFDYKERMIGVESPK